MSQATMARRRAAAPAAKKETKFVARLLADLHLHDFTEFATLDENGISSRLIKQVETIEELALQESEGCRPDTIIIAGDLVHKRGVLSPSVVWAVRRVVDFLRDNYRRVYIIPGNHDYQLKRGTGWLNSLVAIEQGTSDSTSGHEVWVLNEPGMVDNEFAFLPWMASKEAYIDCLNKLAETARGTGHRPVLISHIAVQGGRLDNGRIHDTGIAPLEFPDDAFRAVLLGDFHTRQVVDPERNIYYIGAPYQMNWGDRHDETRGAVDLELTDTGVKLHVIRSNHPRFIIANSVPDARKFREAGHWVRVEVEGPAKARAAISEGFAAAVLPPLSPAKRLDVSPDSSVMRVLDQYMATLDTQYNELGDEGFDRETLRSTCLEIIESIGVQDLESNGHLDVLEVEAKNFLSYAKLGPLSLDQQGVVLLDGMNCDDPDADSNGAGKSAIVETIMYGLFGETLRDSSVGNLTKRNSKGGMFVRVKARISGGRILEVIRCRKAKEYPDGLTYTVNGVPGEAADPRKAQAAIDELTGTPSHLFRQIALFGQEVHTLFAASTDKERKELLESLCASRQFVPLHAKAKERLADVEKFVDELKESQFLLNKTIDQLWSQLQDAELKAKGHKESLKAQATEKIQQAETREQLADGVMKQKKDMEVQLETLKADRPEQVTDEQVDEQFKREREARQNVSDARAEARSIARDIEDIAHVQEPEEGVECQSCRQKVTSKAMAAYRKKKDAELTELRAKLAEADAKVAELVVAADAEQDKTQRLSSQCRSYNNSLHEEKNLVQQIANLQAQIDNLVRESETLRKDAEALQERSANPWIEQAEQLKGQYDSKKAELEVTEKDLAEIEILVPYVKEVVRLFGNQGLRTFLFDALAPDITTRANEALQILSSGALQVTLTTETRGASEKIVVDVDNIYGSPEYAGNSGGQKRKIDLALAWAISGMVESKCNFLFIDEAFDTLDRTAGRRVVDLLAERKATKGTIIVTTHREEFREYFPVVWTAKLKDGESQLLQEVVST